MTKTEIDLKYTNLCVKIGDLYVKQEQIEMALAARLDEAFALHEELKGVMSDETKSVPGVVEERASDNQSPG